MKTIKELRDYILSQKRLVVFYHYQPERPFKILRPEDVVFCYENIEPSITQMSIHGVPALHRTKLGLDNYFETYELRWSEFDEFLSVADVFSDIFIQKNYQRVIGASLLPKEVIEILNSMPV